MWSDLGNTINNFIIHEQLRHSCHLRQISDELNGALLCSELHLLTPSLHATRESFLSFCRNMQPSGILKVILPWHWPMRCSVLPRNRASLCKCFLQLYFHPFLWPLIFSCPPSWTHIKVFQSTFMSHILSDNDRVK